MESKELTICTPDYTQVPPTAQEGAKEEQGSCYHTGVSCCLDTARWRKSTGMKREPPQRTMTEVRPWQEISLSLRSLVFRPLPAQPTYVSKKSLQHHCLNLLPSVPASERARDQALFHCSSSPASLSRYQPSHLMFPSELQRVLPQSSERKPSDQMKLAFLDWEVSGPACST